MIELMNSRNVSGLFKDHFVKFTLFSYFIALLHELKRMFIFARVETNKRLHGWSQPTRGYYSYESTSIKKTME